MSNFRGWEIVIILALLVVLFGSKRLPDAARGLGRSMRIFKAETKAFREEGADHSADATATPAPTAAPLPPRELEGTTAPREQVAPPRPAEPETHDR
ncbi:MAG: sec-independent protein translocase protein TatA [Actinomycetota bacterium]|jgi:sec-independent protein translocase protein TatA|nr:sec-independent protein translocase protein TatA [Actinomycetota bacterium]